GSFIATAKMSGHITIIPELQTTAIHSVKGLSVQWAGLPRANSVNEGYLESENSPSSKFSVFRSRSQSCSRERLVNELKGAYLYLASDAAAYTTGTDIIVEG
ncbi:hypothetical protein B9Z19DRAFT_903242, partial [Tuber borchii]